MHTSVCTLHGCECVLYQEQATSVPLALQADEERAAAAAKKDFFTKSLAEMRLVQSKVTRAVVEAQQRCVGYAPQVPAALQNQLHVAAVWPRM